MLVFAKDDGEISLLAEERGLLLRNLYIGTGGVDDGEPPPPGAGNGLGSDTVGPEDDGAFGYPFEVLDRRHPGLGQLPDNAGVVDDGAHRVDRPRGIPGRRLGDIQRPLDAVTVAATFGDENLHESLTNLMFSDAVVTVPQLPP